ncbi:T9SS type A sorting domain-containing protein [Haliscomenobacter sp.]|uniref:T9SS type A sorting domain-containing protein n=1 Tax=Haliscomenobacter sp. TaxID=2717303 RepID=UPI003364D390
MKCHSLVLVGTLVFSAVLGKAQSLSPEVISSAGGKMQAGRIQLAWTLGETAVARWTSPQGFVTEGFHQPILEVTLLPKYTAPTVRIAPNPVQSTLNVQLQEPNKQSLFANLVDVGGRVLINRTALQLGNTELDLSNLPSGVYFLNVMHQSGQPVEVFKVVKTH